MPDPIVITTGRPMTGALQRALDNLTGKRRELAVRALNEADSPILGDIHRAIATELLLCGIREADTRREFRAMTQASIPDPPFRPATGPAMHFDPETDQFTEIPDDSSGDLP